MEQRFSASRWLDRLRDSGATHSSMLGVMVDFVLRQPPTDHDQDHSLRSVWMVPCLPDLSRRFRDRFGIERLVTSYGTSESAWSLAVSSTAQRTSPRGRSGTSSTRSRWSTRTTSRSLGRGRRDRRPHEAPVDRDPRLLRHARAHDRGFPQPLASHRRRGPVRRGRHTFASSIGWPTACAGEERTSPPPTSSMCSALTPSWRKLRSSL